MVVEWSADAVEWSTSKRAIHRWVAQLIPPACWMRALRCEFDVVKKTGNLERALSLFSSFRTSIQKGVAPGGFEGLVFLRRDFLNGVCHRTRSHEQGGQACLQVGTPSFVDRLPM